jgi:hypothetical protein
MFNKNQYYIQFSGGCTYTVLDQIRLYLTTCIHCEKKATGFPVPSRDGTYYTLPGREHFNYSRPGTEIIKKDDEPCSI